jgi:hypothetical protein
VYLRAARNQRRVCAFVWGSGGFAEENANSRVHEEESRVGHWLRADVKSAIETHVVRVPIDTSAGAHQAQLNRQQHQRANHRRSPRCRQLACRWYRGHGAAR